MFFNYLNILIYLIIITNVLEKMPLMMYFGKIQNKISARETTKIKGFDI